MDELDREETPFDLQTIDTHVFVRGTSFVARAGREMKDLDPDEAFVAVRADVGGDAVDVHFANHDQTGGGWCYLHDGGGVLLDQYLRPVDKDGRLITDGRILGQDGCPIADGRFVKDDERFIDCLGLKFTGTILGGFRFSPLNARRLGELLVQVANDVDPDLDAKLRAMDDEEKEIMGDPDTGEGGD
jgi:hypothetical protein